MDKRKSWGSKRLSVYSVDYIVCRDDNFALKESLRTCKHQLHTFDLAILVDDFFSEITLMKAQRLGCTALIPSINDFFSCIFCCSSEAAFF